MFVFKINIIFCGFQKRVFQPVLCKPVFDFKNLNFEYLNEYEKHLCNFVR